MICPCCNQPTDYIEPTALVLYLPVSGAIRTSLLKELAKRFGQEVPSTHLAHCAWTDIDGGPDNLSLSLRQHMHALRRALAPFKITITGRSGVYWSDRGGYKMEWIR